MDRNFLPLICTQSHCSEVASSSEDCLKVTGHWSVQGRIIWPLLLTGDAPLTRDATWSVATAIGKLHPGQWATLFSVDQTNLFRLYVQQRQWCTLPVTFLVPVPLFAVSSVSAIKCTVRSCRCSALRKGILSILIYAILQVQVVEYSSHISPNIAYIQPNLVKVLAEDICH